MPKRMCPKCKRLVMGDECAVHPGQKLVDNWKGRILVIEPEKSELAKKMKIDQPGEYALR